jgi:hypothetical protein
MSPKALIALDRFLLSQANIQKQKAALQKQAVSVKAQQKEMQTATLELGSCISEFSLFLHCWISIKYRTN